MYSNSVALIEMSESDSISVCVYIENKGIFEFGQRIYQKFENAYMNGYNWNALITHYVNSIDSNLMIGVGQDPEAGMSCFYIKGYNAENLQKMKCIEEHIKTMLGDEDVLLKFIEGNYTSVEWD